MWAVRIFSIQHVSRYLEVKDYMPMRELLDKLLHEVKRMEDHRLLVEIHLLDSQLMLALRDIAKSRVWHIDP